jgi:hypothetical protein
LNEEQTKAYKVALNHMSDPKQGQLVMFISGESCSGKSQLINVIAQGADLLFNSYKDNEEKRRIGPSLKTAPTGVGAFNIGGEVWMNILEKNLQYHPKALTPRVIEKLQSRLAGVKVFLLDQLNLLSLEDLFEISNRLSAATGDYTKPFGGLHIVMSGDFFQVRTLTGTPILKTDFAMSNTRAMRGRAIFKDSMTHYVCLTYRAGGLLGPLAEFVRAARLGSVSRHTLEEMNNRVIHDMDLAMRKAHPKALWVSDNLVRVDHINHCFLRMMEHELDKRVIRLLASHFSSKQQDRPRYIDIPTQHRLLSIHGGITHNLAPLIVDMCVGSRVKLNANLFPSIGLYCGAMGTVVGFVYQGEGQKPSILRSCLAEADHELPVVLVRMDGDDDAFPCSCVSSVSRVVPITPLPSPNKIEVDGRRFIRFQVPLALAHARASRALSGYSIPHGIVSDVHDGKFFGGQYVALSRASSAEKIQLLAPLQLTQFTNHPDFRLAVHAEYSRLKSTFSSDTLTRFIDNPAVNEF